MKLINNSLKAKNSAAETNLQKINKKPSYIIQPNDMTNQQVYQTLIQSILTQNHENQKQSIQQWVSKFMDLDSNIQQLQLLNKSGHQQQKQLLEQQLIFNKQLVQTHQKQIQRLKQQSNLINQKYNLLAQKYRNSQFSLSKKAYEIVKSQNQAKRMQNKIIQLLNQKQKLENINQETIQSKESRDRQIVLLKQQNKLKQAELEKIKDQKAKIQTQAKNLSSQIRQSKILQDDIQKQKLKLLNSIKQIVKSTKLQNSNNNQSNKNFQKDQSSFFQFYVQMNKIQQNFTKLKQSLNQKQQDKITKTNQIYNKTKTDIENSLNDINNKNNSYANQIDKIIGPTNKMINNIKVNLYKLQKQNENTNYNYFTQQFKLMNQSYCNFMKNQVEFIKEQNGKNIKLIGQKQMLNQEIERLNGIIMSLKGQIGRLKAQIVKLNPQIAQLKQRTKDLESQSALKSAQIQSLKDQITKLNEILAQKLAQIQALKEQEKTAKIKFNKTILQLQQTNQIKINKLNLNYQQQIRKLKLKHSQQIKNLQKVLTDGNNQSGKTIFKLNEQKRKLGEQLLAKGEQLLATNTKYQKKVNDLEREIYKLRQSITPFLCESAVLDCCREDEKQHILWIKQQIESFVGTKIASSRTLFRKAKTNFHHYVDNIPNLLLIVKLQIGDKTARIAAFTQNGFVKKAGLQRGNGILLSLQTKKSYKLKQQQDVKALSYDQYNLKWGNDQIRIGLNNSSMFSNFGVSSGYYNPDGDNLRAFIGPTPNKQYEIISYELLQIRFYKGQYVNKFWANQAQIIQEGRFN